MAFLDKLSKTVTEASQKTIAKTKELADTSRLNSMISDEEKIINNQYFQIGKLYVAVHQDNYEEDFAGMINTILESEAKIKDYKKQIQEIKGVRRCEKCGAEVPNGLAFCSACGAVMPKIQSSVSADIIKCENCGAEVRKGMRFCTSCGKPMECRSPHCGGNYSKNSTGKICPNCGATVGDEVVFCTECGTKL